MEDRPRSTGKTDSSDLIPADIMVVESTRADFQVRLDEHLGTDEPR
jgi:hypothetical protein